MSPCPSALPLRRLRPQTPIPAAGRSHLHFACCACRKAAQAMTHMGVLSHTPTLTAGRSHLQRRISRFGGQASTAWFDIMPAAGPDTQQDAAGMRDTLRWLAALLAKRVPRHAEMWHNSCCCVCVQVCVLRVCASHMLPATRQCLLHWFIPYDINQPHCSPDCDGTAACWACCIDAHASTIGVLSHGSLRCAATWSTSWSSRRQQGCHPRESCWAASVKAEPWRCWRCGRTSSWRACWRCPPSCRSPPSSRCSRVGGKIKFYPYPKLKFIDMPLTAEQPLFSGGWVGWVSCCLVS